MVRSRIAIPSLLWLAASLVVADTAHAADLTHIDAGRCSADEASIKAHPVLYPASLKNQGIKGVVVADLILTAEVATATAPASGDVGNVSYRVGDLRIVQSARNRDLDRVVMQAARSWRFTCPPGTPESALHARVEATLDPALTSVAMPTPRPAVSAFPGWAMAMLISPPLAKVARDDQMIDAADTAAIKGRVEADPTFKKDGIRKPFDMYARWDDQAKQSEIWWFLREAEGRADAVVLIKDNYGKGRRDYAARCESGEEACVEFERWLKFNMASWHPMAEWN